MRNFSKNNTRECEGKLQIVAGTTLKSIEPRVWDESSPYYLSQLQAIMFTYADFHRMPAARRRAMEQGLHASLGVPQQVKIFLDNGSFYFSMRGQAVPVAEYEEFVTAARPDWYPIPQDFIPTPNMEITEQRDCLTRTMDVNRAFEHDGFVPVIHISRVLPEYVAAMRANDQLASKPALALGGIVPNLLRAPKSLTHSEILDCLRVIRRDFADKKLHVFGIGGTATLHLAALLQLDSVDSSGWRNRAARGVIQLPGSGERVVAQLGSWKGRELSQEEEKKLKECLCPACQQFGFEGLKATAVFGFRNRATHNLWTLLEEANWLTEQLKHCTYNTFAKLSGREGNFRLMNTA
jgi:hypothetical protein